METLICQQCNAEKPLEQFRRYKKGSDRRRPYCKACHAAHEKWYRDQRRELLGADHPLLQAPPRKPRRRVPEPTERTCRACRVTKALAEFVWADKHHRLHRNLCKACNVLHQSTLRERKRLESMNPRVCAECNITKPAEDFHWRIKRQFERQRRCKECAAQLSFLHGQEQKILLGEEGMAAYQKERYQKYRDKQLASHKDHYQKNDERIKASSRQFYANNKESIKQQSRVRRLRVNFGLTIEDYNAMLIAQNHACAICGRNGSKLQVDHCHATGRIRGLLCIPCNSFLGRIKDSIDTLEHIKHYLLAVRP
jgi:hypothetical protein